VAGQTPLAASPSSDTGRQGLERFSLQVAAGPTLTLVGGGSVVSAGLGYSPAPRLELLLNVERTSVPFHLSGGATRGGTLAFVSGEVRVALWSADRVSPFAIVGGGRGVSHPTVNEVFPDRVTNDLRVLYVGGGVRVPLSRGFSLTGEARCVLGLEGYDGILAVWPVRAGLAWRF
jgi:hypothetical protein